MLYEVITRDWPVGGIESGVDGGVDHLAVEPVVVGDQVLAVLEAALDRLVGGAMLAVASYNFV